MNKGNYASYKDLPKTNGEKTVENVNSNNPNLVIIESSEHKQQLINNSKVLIVDIYGDFCGPCKIVAPKYEKIANEYASAGIPFVFSKEDVMKKLSPYIKGVPAFEYYLDGKIFGTTVGADDVEIRSKLEELKNIVLTQNQQHNSQSNPHIRNVQMNMPQPQTNNQMRR